jgi:UDP-N-acetylglucosamine 2-epimerase (non-hydrolysing)
LKIALVVGTRPEIIKMSPVVNVLRERGIEFCLILTGQHKDYDMSMRFIEELGLPPPTCSFKLAKSKPASLIGEIMTRLERTLESMGSELLLIQGDTDSMLAAALTGAKLGIRIAHVEAGLRSYDWRMPEEHNRRMVDHVSDVLLAPTELSKRNLINEHVYGRIFVTGNTVVDAVNHYLPLAPANPDILNRIPFPEFCLATIHRKENVDSPETLRELVDVLVEMETSVIFPVHPRTALRLHEFGLHEKLAHSSHVCLLPPIGYIDTLILMRRSKFIMTDSGGVQEEATVPLIRRPVVLVRTSTERPEAVEAGFTWLAGVSKTAVLKTIRMLLSDPPALPDRSPFGDGKAAERVVNAVTANLS